VPFSSGLGEAIAKYMELRRAVAPSPDSFLLLNFRGRSYSVGNFAMRFHELQRAGGVPHRHSRHQPRVHDTRHTFAVTNLLRWYREGRDVMAMLPLLATYMGHVDVLSTQHYLRATPELLREASQRFERAHGSLVTAALEVVDEI
jgi:integrase/recombinase XerD